MGQALRLARRAAARGEVPVGAVVVRDDRLVGQGANRPIGDCDPTAHAEIVALRDAARTLRNYRLPGTTLYVTLEPCPMCAGAMVHARVERLVWAAPDLRAGAVESAMRLFEAPGLNHRVRAERGPLGEEAGALLRGFFRARR